MIDLEKIKKNFIENKSEKPFDNWVFEDFFDNDIAKTLEEEFPDYDDKIWHEWSNPLEDKKARNDWNVFPSTTYKVISYLNSPLFVNLISKYTNTPNLIPDMGLNGAGWHIHRSGGYNNVHLDYSVHPKLKYQRKFNLIIYLTPEWKKDWGGSLGFYSQDKDEKKPGKLIKSVYPKHNRAVFFDTTQNSWHGLPEPIKCPDNICRKSIALYYLRPADSDVEQRGRALFSPNKDQIDNPEVLELIKKRSSVSQSKEVYITKKK